MTGGVGAQHDATTNGKNHKKDGIRLDAAFFADNRKKKICRRTPNALRPGTVRDMMKSQIILHGTRRGSDEIA